MAKSKKKGCSHGAHRMGVRAAATAPIPTGAAAFHRLEWQNRFGEWRRRRRQAHVWMRGRRAEEWRTGARGGSFTTEAAPREKSGHVGGSVHGARGRKDRGQWCGVRHVEEGEGPGGRRSEIGEVTRVQGVPGAWLLWGNWLLARPTMNSNVSDLFKIFKLIQICHGSKYTFPC
jgi:hypothetical protein